MLGAYSDKVIEMTESAGESLNGRQRYWARYWVANGFNATAAARDAGYAAGACAQAGYANAHHRVVLAYVSELCADVDKRTETGADYLRVRLREMAELDIADIVDGDGWVLPIWQWPRAWRISVNALEVQEIIEQEGRTRDVVGVLKKIKLPDKLKVAELLGRHIGVRAWDKDAIEHNVTNNIMLVPNAASVDDWEAIAQQQQEVALNVASTPKS